MGFNYNQSILMGRLTKDPDFKQVTDTFCKLTFTLAINRPRRRDGSDSDADFISIVLTDHTALLGSKLLFKGSPVLLWGRLQVRHYDTKDNERKWITEVMGENFQVLERA